ncbi:glycosyl hydrolase family 28-related protein [Micromonospora sp. 4G57]|uniref:Glycosyl hydrolase family 28-related protein n=1 Tax=Micromonospora sicca TaxID=2202420 RepID=A0ABU5JCD2_9ACTN|nr:MULTISPECIES: glycosyl hydrolase family 28-related protein [unclassified Micromonospora]MDZ5441659.1 glycosyl hydrolase family 28-related protein [Micromonospora sp. 4G57]MDZ5490220.1 glycosyl hydrolase family 28-related protein [Micromonospora sp. 4G53]
MPPITHPAISRRGLFGLGAATTVATTLAGAARPARAASVDAVSQPRDASADLLEQWRAAHGCHPLVPDVSAAGYRLGERPPTPSVVTKVTDFGARPDGTDCTAAFNAAVRQAGEHGGGVVLVPPGTYTLSGPVWMHWSGVVLRGVGRDSTVLHFARTLDDGYRPNRQSNGNSRWSWTGGQIWFVSPERRARSEAEDYAGTEGWLLGDVLAEVGAASRGQRTLVVSGTSRLTPGDMVVLECQNPPDAGLLKHLAGDVPGTRDYDWPRGAPQLVTGSGGQYVQYATLQWPVRVEAVLGERLVRLAQPLKYDLRPGWPARLRAIGPTVRDAGVEHLTVRNELVPQTAHNRHPGSNGVCFQAVHDCWARDVRVENCDLGFGLTSAKSITITDVTVGGRAAHHSFACRMQSNDNLVEDFEIERFSVPVPSGAIHHGLNLEGLSAGNVYRRGRMAEGTFDTHRALPFENARTDITLENNGRVGGSAASGPLFGARMAHWNVRITNGRPYAVTIADVAPRSVTVGVQGVEDTSSGLSRDFSGDLESLLADHGSAPSVADLYAAQRGQVPLSG